MHHQFYVMPIIESIKMIHVFGLHLCFEHRSEDHIRPFLHIADLFT